MKTEKQIERWLKSHKWYESYRRQAMIAHGVDCTTMDALQSCHGKLTILGAFNWMDSDEGPEFWKDVHKKFIKWFAL